MYYWVGYSGSEKYCYAANNNSFVAFNQSICDVCGRTIYMPQFISSVPHLQLDGGRIFPDFLQFCGAGERMFLISETALKIFEENHISGYSTYCEVVVEPYIKRGLQSKQPRYYQLKILGRIDFNLSAMCLKRKRKCTACGQFDWNRQRIYPKILDPTTWDLSDLCLVASFPGTIVCSDTIAKLVKEHNLSGLDLKPT